MRVICVICGYNALCVKFIRNRVNIDDLASKLLTFGLRHASCQTIRTREVLHNMKLAYSSKKISGYLLAFFLLFGIVTVASSTAQAQWGRDNDRYRRDRRDDRRDDRYRDRYNNYQVAASRATVTA